MRNAACGAERISFHAPDCGTIPVAAQLSRFQGESGVREFHLSLQPTREAGFRQQLEWLEAAYRRALAEADLAIESAVMRRFFCSDPANQAAVMEAHPLSSREQAGTPCAVSWVGQPPLPPARLALWAYHIGDPAGLEKRQAGRTLTLTRGALDHHWTTGLCSAGGSAHAQTRGVFLHYDGLLRERGLTLADHALRTWLFVRDMDADYAEMVVARREFFAERGLLPETHFIASSGIGGGQADPAVKVALDAYALGGAQREQIEYLRALDHLSPTHVYGVTFERGTAVAYRDRRHVLLSGTASIDREGRVLYEGDLARQLERTLENVAALLETVGAGHADVAAWIIYARDAADLASAGAAMRARIGAAPMVVVAAPVCRPAWLIEVEGMAVMPAQNPELPAF